MKSYKRRLTTGHKEFSIYYMNGPTLGGGHTNICACLQMWILETRYTESYRLARA